MITSLMLVDRKYALAKNIDSQLANGARLSNLFFKHRENDFQIHTLDLYGEGSHPIYRDLGFLNPSGDRLNQNRQVGLFLSEQASRCFFFRIGK